MENKTLLIVSFCIIIVLAFMSLYVRFFNYFNIIICIALIVLISAKFENTGEPWLKLN